MELSRYASAMWNIKTGRVMQIEVRIASQADLSELYVNHLVELVNSVYLIAEEGLWIPVADGFPGRTSVTEIKSMWASERLGLAWLGSQIIGCVHVDLMNAGRAEFGMLVTAPEYRGQGLGLHLIKFAEDWARRRGCRTMQLELLTPRDWVHPVKETLHDWYGRLGYQPVRAVSLKEALPHLVMSLSTPCKFTIYEKSI